MFEMHIYALLLLGLVFLTTYYSSVVQDRSLKLFRSMTLMVMVNLLFELFLWLPIPRYLVISINTILFAITPLATFLLVFYADCIVQNTVSIVNSWVKLRYVPMALNLILVLANFYTGWLFEVNSEGVYSRGPLFLMSAMLSYAYLAIALWKMYKNRKWLTRRELDSFIAFAVFPCAGGLLQITTNYWVTWPSFALSIVYIYITIQEKQISTEAMTGLKARRYFASVMDQKIAQISANDRTQTFIAHLIDLDHFKSINDIYGHNAGDIALITFSRLLNESFLINDVICRYGGDEFVVLLDRQEISNLSVQKLSEKVALFNETSGHPWKLEFSLGSMVFEAAKFQNRAQFMDALDQEMYKHKHKQKRA